VILDDAYDIAKQIISENKSKLVELADTLIKVETLDRDEFEAVMNRELPEEEPAVEPIEQ
jgi:ATP-dependent Zn protease